MDILRSCLIATAHKTLDVAEFGGLSSSSDWQWEFPFKAMDASTVGHSVLERQRTPGIQRPGHLWREEAKLLGTRQAAEVGEREITGQGQEGAPNAITWVSTGPFFTILGLSLLFGPSPKPSS